MDSVSLRAQLAKDLRRHDIPDEVWKDLEEKRFVEEAMAADFPDGKATCRGALKGLGL